MELLVHQCFSSLPWHCRSRAALTYAEAQSRIDDERLQDELSVNLRRMNAVAKVLRRQRAERGALQLASPEVKFEIDTETHDPLDVGMYQVCTPLCTLRKSASALNDLQACPDGSQSRHAFCWGWHF